MSLEVVNDSILNSPEGEEYAGPDMSAGAANVPRDSGIGPLPASAATSGGEYKLPADLLRAPHSRDRAGGGGGAADDSDDDDDEIAATLPIYLHHSLAPALTQFQYPLQHRNLRVPTWAEERGKKITARVKEQSGRIDVEVPIDADPKVWRDERAKELTFVPGTGSASASAASTPAPSSARGKKAAAAAAAKPAAPAVWGDKMRLRSEPVPISGATAYFSGIVHDGALHLHPVSRVLQFRTELAYMDPPEAPAPKALDDPRSDGSGSLKDFRNRMWAMAGREQNEPWVPYEWRDDGTETAERLLIDEESKVDLEVITRGLDYLDRA